MIYSGHVRGTLGTIERANLIVRFDVLTFNRRIDLKDMMMEKTSQTSVEARRSFLKKVAYAAPAIVALGALSTPKSAHATDSGLSFTDTNGNNVDLSNTGDATSWAQSFWK
jgi:hypothetical protein